MIMIKHCYIVSLHSKIIVMDTVQPLRSMRPSQMTTSRLQTALVANHSVVMGRLWCTVTTAHMLHL